jgi:hypothetical protein
LNLFGMEKKVKTASQVRKEHPRWAIECLQAGRSTRGGLMNPFGMEKEVKTAS